MGGFANLKRQFDENNMLESFRRVPALVEEGSGMNELATYLALRCMFEIAGNLDTIAIEMREQTKIMRENADRSAETMKGYVETFASFAEKIINPPVYKLDPEKIPLRYQKHPFLARGIDPETCRVCGLAKDDIVHRVIK